MSTTFSLVTPWRIDTNCPSPRVVRVAPVGEVDLATAGMLREELRRALSMQIHHQVDVDLAGVTFMDCTGLTVLVIARHTAVRSGRELRITNPQPIVHRLLELTGLLAALTAAFDGDPPTPPGSASASRTGPTPTVAAQPTDLLIAA